jgi:carbon storage regulator CsrA
MLVLTRTLGEQIVIDGDIVVTVTAIEGNKVRLGVQAPKSVSIDRAEIHQRKLEEKAGRKTRIVRETALVCS